jgi:hypothetical protein
MSIEAKHNDKIQSLCNHQTTIQKVEHKVKELEKKRSKKENLLDMLELDEEIYNEHKKLDKLRSENHYDYLLKVSGILKEYYQDNDDTFEKCEFVSLGSMNGFVEQKQTNRRGQLFSEYMRLIQETDPQGQHPGISKTNNTIETNDHMTCTDCNQEMKLSVNESYIVCENCGTYETYFEPSVTGLTYEQEINADTNVHFAYKRINHLRELLAQLQAKESSDIPDEILQQLRAEFVKSRIQNMSEITQEKVKYYLKKLHLNKYYEHARQITNVLSGKPPPFITKELYEKLINMFTDIQEPFERVCPKNRKNFFSYNYILYKFCELLGEYEIMKLFPLLKSREKLYQQDCIWKNICAIMDWTFYKSV